ncbi:MAG: isoleucine--tRNA ligase [Candidatus Gracilibacteria bacterium]|jgi:isoleucyl-tRNA synthetase
MYRPVDSKTHLPEIEHKHMEFWKRKNIFERSVEQRKGKPKFVFFDGPPFANGLPHYGHIMALSLKDAVTRYQTMQGFFVPRVNGWDCHGLPVEYEIEKELELSGRKDIEKLGVEKFNTKCRESVFRYTEQWGGLFERIARWVDTENGYATLDANYMESIWWVFKQIWEKGMMYQGFKSMHVCPRCSTPLSNFEVSQGYKDVTDLTVTAQFRSKENSNLYFLAWTTTPWTLPGNVALAVGKEIDYVQISKEGKSFILAKALLEKHFDMDGLTIEKEMKGADLVGQKYEPLFSYYENADLPGIETAWRVIATDFVTTEDGTGIVHIAPGYGEDDYLAGKAEGLPVIQHVGMNGHFEKEVLPWAGKFVKGQENAIADWLEENGLLFKKENFRHSYPHCWRCDTPLLNYATKAWFIRVTEIKERLQKNNQKIHWQPDHIKDGRFGKWLETVRDWNISRNRFWGTPLPIWTCDSCEKQVCIGSVEELKKMSGGKLPTRDGELDLHKPYIDEIKLTCPDCSSPMTRISEVLDCWFESGAMPYAQLHYPFENKEEFEKNFPANFIAEGLDQTRGWFYTLHVLATILFDEPAFKNVIVNGILLAADGEKLSKRKKNYPDPNLLFEEKGVDTVRMFLYTSTAPLAEDVRFSEQHVDDLLKKFTLTLWNTYSFFVTYANIDQFEAQDAPFEPKHKLDQWILSYLNTLTEEVTQNMEDYNLTKATRPMVEFVDHLSNWYIRRSRRRFWKSENDADKWEAYQTLHTVLVQFSQLLAPFMPFISDEIYRNLTNQESVHLTDWPKADKKLINTALNQEVALARQIVNLGHAIRGKKKIRVRQPLSKVVVGLPHSIDPKVVLLQKEVILEELNVKELELLKDPGEVADFVAIPNAKLLGPKYGKEVQKIIQEAKAGHFTVSKDGKVEVAGYSLEPEELELAYKGKEGVDIESEDGIVVSLDTEISDDLYLEGLMRELIRVVQDMRKEANFEVSDHIQLLIETSGQLEEAVTRFADSIKEETLAEELSQKGNLDGDLEKKIEIDGISAKVGIKRINP